MRQLLALAALALLLPVAACGDDKPVPPKGDGGTSPPSAWRAAVGAGGTFAQTFDDVRWESRALGTATMLAVACVGNRDGWAVGEGGLALHTVDGGRTWSAQPSGTSVALRAVRFGDRDHGVIAGDAGFLARTADGGAHWSRVESSTTDALRGAAVAWGAATWVVVGDRGLVLRSVDAGASWSSSTLAGAGALRGVAVDVGAHVVLAVDDAGAIWSSGDGAHAFRREADAGAPLDAISIADDGSAALAVGARGIALARSASGAWRATPTGTTADLHAALVTKDATGVGARFYAAGEGGSLVTRADGSPWSTVPLPTSAALYGLEDL